MIQLVDVLSDSVVFAARLESTRSMTVGHKTNRQCMSEEAREGVSTATREAMTSESPLNHKLSCR